MTKRRKALELALGIWRFSLTIDASSKSGLFQTFSYWLPSGPVTLRTGAEARQLAHKIARQAKYASEKASEEEHQPA